tara:strand:+ start:255 stop:518 length:264 start_codon:yes stop_codon:yes gene_type:complete
MAERELGWRWFEDIEPSSDDDRQPEIEKSFARCFSGPDGDRVLAHLRAMTIDRVLGPEAGDAELRHLEGQRHLVIRISAMIARGRDQ